MPAALHHVAFPPQILTRGFWLYVWKIRLPNNSDAFYIGMTGDTGSSRAQSPFNRISAHLGSNIRNNALRRYLQKLGVNPECCVALDFLAYGPLYEIPVPQETQAYRATRGKVAALEKRLWLTLKDRGLVLLNNAPQSKSELDKTMWQDVDSAFSHLGLSRPA